VIRADPQGFQLRHGTVPDVILEITIQNYPQFDLGIPDQFRFDIKLGLSARLVSQGVVPPSKRATISRLPDASNPKLVWIHPVIAMAVLFWR